jgi:hypothetical protein
VELDDNFKICPLCGKDPSVGSEQKNSPVNNPSQIIQIRRQEVRRSLWELSAIIAFSAIAVCTIVDLIISRNLGWSLLSVVSIAAGWIIFTLFFHAYRKTWIILPGLFVTIILALFFINLLAGGKWFIGVGLPLSVAAFASIGLIILLYRVANLKGLNVIAAAFLVLAGFCIAIEIILDRFFRGVVDLRWSLIAAISILPVSLLFLFYHYRLKKGNRLDSFFHI